MKCVLVGAGSFVFAPTVIDDLYTQCRVPAELWLVDTDLSAAQRMARVAEAVAGTNGLKPVICACSDWNDALDGADAVFFSAAVQGKRRYMIDAEILKGENLADQARECGGLAGLSYALRTCTLILKLCADMRRVCPDAVLLDAANPLPRVACAANRYGGIRTYGFCSAAVGPDGKCEQVGRLLGRDARQLKITAAGVNHFSFLISCEDASTGENLMPQVERLTAAGGFGADRRYFYETYGGVCMLPADHAADFVACVPSFVRRIVPPFHGDEAERSRRVLELENVAQGGSGWADIVARSSWEHPAQAASALFAGQSCDLAALNVTNDGNIPEIGAGEYVEVPASIREGTVQARRGIVMPGKTGEICRRVSRIHALCAEAAATGRRSILDEILESDPALEACDPAAARRALERMLKAHADCLPQFGL